MGVVVCGSAWRRSTMAGDLVTDRPSAAWRMLKGARQTRRCPCSLARRRSRLGHRFAAGRRRQQRICCQPTPHETEDPVEEPVAVESEATDSPLPQVIVENPATAPSPPQMKQKVLILSSGSQSLMSPVPYPSWFGAPSSVIMAAIVLVAIRFGRWSAERKQLSRFGTQGQLSIDEWFGVNRELALRRREFEKKRAATMEEETTHKLKQAEQRAKEETTKKLEREEKYKAEQEEEAKRLQSLKQKEKERFEQQEQVMQSELEKRMEVERQIQAEMEAKRKAEEEKQRQIEAENRRLEEERRALAEAEYQRQLEEEKKKKLEAKMALSQLKTKQSHRALFDALHWSVDSLFGLRGRWKSKDLLQGHHWLQRRFRWKIILHLESTQERQLVDSLVTDPRDVVTLLYEMCEGFVCRGAMDQYVSDARLQSMTGSGPLSHMDDTELDLFARCACLCAHCEMDKTVQSLIAEFEMKPSVQSHEKSLQVRTEWGVLPQGHEKRLDSVINSILDELSVKGVKESGIQRSLEELLASETEDVEGGYEHGKEACFLAHVFDRALKTNNSAIYDASVSVLRSLLEQICASAPLDSLMPQSVALSAALGEEHPIHVWFQELALKNQSPQKKAEAAQKKSRMDAALKARVLEQEWPDQQQISAELLKEREESTPVPERVWALRNVARTLATSASPSESAVDQSIDLMKKALRLQQRHLGSSSHPGMLGPLRDYAEILDRVDPNVSVMIWEQVVAILEAMMERYRKQGDLFSAAVCAETGILQGENALEMKHPSIKKLGKASEALFEVLDDKQKTRFLEIRRSGSGMDLIVEAFTSQLAAYKNPGKLDRSEAWTENEALDSL